MERGSGESDVTPLLAAAQKGYLEMAQVLLESGASVDRPSRDPGTTPLLAASHAGHLEVVELLVAHGADYQRVTDGATALSLAYDAGQMQVALFLQGLRCKRRRT